MASKRVAYITLNSPKEFWELYKTLKDPKYEMDWEVRATLLKRMKRTKFYKEAIYELERKKEEEKIKKIEEEERKEVKYILGEEII